MTGMREAKNPNAKAPTKPRRLRRSDDDLDACDGKTEAECNEAAFDGLECEAEDMIGKKANSIRSIRKYHVTEAHNYCSLGTEGKRLTIFNMAVEKLFDGRYRVIMAQELKILGNYVSRLFSHILISNFFKTNYHFFVNS